MTDKNEKRLNALLAKLFIADTTVRTNIQLSGRRGTQLVDLTGSTLKAVRIKKAITRIITNDPELNAELSKRNNAGGGKP